MPVWLQHWRRGRRNWTKSSVRKCVCLPQAELQKDYSLNSDEELLSPQTLVCHINPLCCGLHQSVPKEGLSPKRCSLHMLPIKPEAPLTCRIKAIRLGIYQQLWSRCHSSLEFSWQPKHAIKSILISASPKASVVTLMGRINVLNSSEVSGLHTANAKWGKLASSGTTTNQTTSLILLRPWRNRAAILPFLSAIGLCSLELPYYFVRHKNQSSSLGHESAGWFPGGLQAALCFIRHSLSDSLWEHVRWYQCLCVFRITRWNGINGVI